MRIVIVGIGKIGYILTAQLCHEGHDVVIIDKNSDVLMQAQNKLDVAVVSGTGASVEIQQEAGVPKADLLIAVTSSDEVNILCSMVAHKLGCTSIIARVRNPEYDRQMQLFNVDLGMAFSVNPEKSTANEIFHLLQFPSFIKRDSFVGGMVDMVELRLSSKSDIAGKSISRMDELLTCKAIVCGVERNGNVVIPTGDFQLLADDRVTVAVPPKKLPNIARSFGVPVMHSKRVMLIGGSKIAQYLAQLLLENRVDVKIIEMSRARCEELAELLPGASVICGNGTEHDLLIEQGIKKVDAVVSLTGVDEENFVISLFAQHMGVPKTITKNNRQEYNELFKGSGIDSVVSPKYLTANQIVRYVRAASASHEGSVDTLYRILDDEVEALGFTVPAAGSFLNVPLKDLKFRKNTLIAVILRGQQIVIPKGDDSLVAGDSIIVVSKAEYAISEITDLFLRGEGARK